MIEGPATDLSPHGSRRLEKRVWNRYKLGLRKLYCTLQSTHWCAWDRPRAGLAEGVGTSMSVGTTNIPSERNLDFNRFGVC